MAIGGDINKFKFPIAKIKNSEDNFSFSGLKTSLYYLIKNNNEEMILENKTDIAASYQETILNTLIQKLIFVAEKTQVYDIFISGGVISNMKFREKIDDLNKQKKYNINCTEMKYCTDNADMIAFLAMKKADNKDIKKNMDFSAYSRGITL